MVNNNLMIGHNQDLLLRPNQYLEHGPSHNSVLDRCLEDIDDYPFNVQDLTPTDDNGLTGNESNRHDVVLHHRDVQSFEENGLAFDSDIKPDADKEHFDDNGLISNESNRHALVLQRRDIQNFQENGLAFDTDAKPDADQEHFNIDDQENPLSPIPQQEGLYFVENHELATGEYCDFLENSSSTVNRDQEGIVMDAPVIQSRTLLANPDQQLAVGQQFPDVHSCRRALRDAAIACHFEMQTIKSDKTRFTAKCAGEGCPWRIHAAKLPGVPTFTIRTIIQGHTCCGIMHLGHQQASVQWVANSMERSLRENPHCKPKEILEEIHRVHGITLSYKQAWRAKERVMATVCGSLEEEFRLLPQYCHQIGRTNPGSIAVVYGNPVDSCFERLFVSFQASIFGFLNACCPLIALDKTILKSKYDGTLLLATGFDGESAVFPLAFGVVDDENDDNWMWFLSELHKLLEANTENMPKLTILSNRQKGMVDGVGLHFPSAFHGFCIRHLIDKFSEEFSNTMLVDLLWEAAHALTVIEFEQKILVIEETSEEAANWIRGINPRLWATAYFEGKSLGHLTANIVEFLDSLILETSGLPIIQMMEHIRRQMMTWFNERRETSLRWTSILVPSAEKQVQVAIEHAHTYQVLKADDAQFEVVSDEGSRIVNIHSRHCSCRGWQQHGLPCAHAAAALISCRQNVYRFAESYFTVANYRKAYSQTIHPIPDKTLWMELSVGFENEGYMPPELIINPPKSLQPPPSKPRKKRARPEDAGRMKRAVHCSRCHQTGHFRTTCTVHL